jgi:GNAT superfamily N-acetyltransferase
MAGGSEDVLVDVDPLLVRARNVWLGLAGEPADFPDAGGVNIVVSPESRLCPRAWSGVILLGGGCLATAPDSGQAAVLRGLLAVGPRDSMSGLAWLLESSLVAETLGPAALAYVDDKRFSEGVGAVGVERTLVEDPELGAFLVSVGSDDVGESGLEGITSPAFVVREHLSVVAAAGYRCWPADVAHMSVLTAPGSRGRGLGRAVAAAAVADALANQMLPQWRARPDASRRVARALGFCELGWQLSLRLR